MTFDPSIPPPSDVGPVPAAYPAPYQMGYAIPADAALGFPDRRGTLKGMGVLLIVLGCLSGCVALVTPVALFVPQQPGVAKPAVRDIVMGALTYVAGATAFVWLGVGSIGVRRWARPIVLVMGWSWLAIGVFALVAWLVFSPSMADVLAGQQPAAPGAPATPAVPAGIATAIGWGVGLFMVALGVGLPALIVWLYSRDGVLQTVNYFDPTPRWTDRCPTPALAVSLWLRAGAAYCLAAAAYPVFPVFGVLVRGAAAAGLFVAAAAVSVWLAWATYRLRPIGWWGAVALAVLWVASSAVTAARVDSADLYRAMGYAPDQVEAMRRVGADAGIWALAGPVVIGVLELAYLLWVRRYFRPTGEVRVATAGA